MPITTAEKARRDTLRRTLKPGMFITCGAAPSPFLMKVGGRMMDVSPEIESDAERKAREDRRFADKYRYWLAS